MIKVMKCPVCGDVEIDVTETSDVNNPKKSTVSGVCPNCSKNLKRIDLDMSKVRR